jgi:L-ascorbate metabolism protein UlaG (beta-lactamase superfamily)
MIAESTSGTNAPRGAEEPAGRPMRTACIALALCWATAAWAEEPVGVSVRWLGVAGVSIRDGDAVLLHDPFFSRPGLMRVLFEYYEPDAALLERLLTPGGPAPELASADWILVGHAHYDHLGDAPFLAARSGARLVGSRTALNLAQGYGLPAERTLHAQPGDVLDAGPFEVRVIESRHAKVALGRVPFEGEVSAPPRGAVHAFSFKLGDARDYLVTHRASGLRIYLSSSAGRHLPALEGLAAEGVRTDLLLAAPIGRDAGHAADLVRTLQPRIAMAWHFDDLFTRADEPAADAPRDPADLEAFEAELRAAAEALRVPLEVRRPVLFEAVALAPGG